MIHLLFATTIVVARAISADCASFPALAVLTTKMAASAASSLKTPNPRAFQQLSSKLKDTISQISSKLCCYSEEFQTIDNTCRSISSVDKDSETDDSSLDEWDSKFWSSFDEDNTNAFGLLMSLDSIRDGWSFVSEKLGVIVEKKLLDAGSFVDKEDAKKGSKHACVKSSAVLDASPESIFNLFADNLRVKEYNEHCAGITDVKVLHPKNYEHDDHSSGVSTAESVSKVQNGHLNDLSDALKHTWSKISHAVTPTYNPFKSRDFLSVVHYQKYANGTSVILNRPAYLSSHRPTDAHVRATVLLAGNIIRPHGEFRNQTHLTLIAQVNPGGGADTPAAAWLLNKLCAVGPPTFIRRLEAAAKNLIPSSPASAAAAGNSVMSLHPSVPEVGGQKVPFAGTTSTAGEFHSPAAVGVRSHSLVEDLVLEAKVSLQDTTARVYSKLPTKLTQLRQNEDFRKLEVKLQKGIRSTVQATAKQREFLTQEWKARRPVIERAAGRYLDLLDNSIRRTGLYTSTLAHIVNKKLIAEMNCRYHCSGPENHLRKVLPPRTAEDVAHSGVDENSADVSSVTAGENAFATATTTGVVSAPAGDSGERNAENCGVTQAAENEQ